MILETWFINLWFSFKDYFMSLVWYQILIRKLNLLIIFFYCNQNILSIFLYLISSRNRFWWLQVIIWITILWQLFFFLHNCLLLLMHDLNKLNSLRLYVKLDPFMKKLHIVQFGIISYFLQIIFYASIIVLWRFNMIEILFNLIFILYLFTVTKVVKL